MTDNTTYWLTSAEHPNWAGPYPVRIEQVERAPDGRDYVRLVSVDGSSDEWERLSAADRFKIVWISPRAGESRNVSIWLTGESDSAIPEPANPSAWCALFATVDEAEDVARKSRMGFGRRVW